jgi:hypothetical protein
MPEARFEHTIRASERAKIFRALDHSATVNGESVIITVLKSVTRKRLVKTEDLYICCGYSDNWSV